MGEAKTLLNIAFRVYAWQVLEDLSVRGSDGECKRSALCVHRLGPWCDSVQIDWPELDQNERYGMEA